MNNVSMLTKCFALVLFVISTFLVKATSEEKLRHLEKEQQKNASLYRKLQEFIAEYWFPVATAGGALLANYCCSDTANKKNSNAPAMLKDYIGSCSPTTASTLYALFFVTSAYIDHKATKPFLKERKKHKKLIDKSIKDLLHNKK